MTAGLDQLLAILWDRSPSVAQLRDAAAQAREAVTEIDAESEAAPSREAATLARMMSPGGPSTVYVLEELRKLEDEASARMLQRKVAVALAAQLDGRVREVEAREAARDPAEVRREQEQARREAEKEALFAKVPVLFRTDFVVSQTRSGRLFPHSAPARLVMSAYARNFTVPRVLANLMAATKVQGWPPRHGDFARIEWPNSEIEEDEKIVGPAPPARREKLMLRRRGHDRDRSRASRLAQ